jgi:hypothetical protein
MRHQNGTLVTHNLSAGNFSAPEYRSCPQTNRACSQILCLSQRNTGMTPNPFTSEPAPTPTLNCGCDPAGRRTTSLKATILCAATLGTYFAVRVFVLHGSMQYHQMSNVSVSHVSENLPARQVGSSPLSPCARTCQCQSLQGLEAF